MDLIDATLNGDIELVRELLENGADINIRDNGGDTPLILASIKGHTDIVRLLLENEANVNSIGYDGDTALIRASDKGYADIVKLLGDVVLLESFAKTRVINKDKVNGTIIWLELLELISLTTSILLLLSLVFLV